MRYFWVARSAIAVTLFVIGLTSIAVADVAPDPEVPCSNKKAGDQCSYTYWTGDRSRHSQVLQGWCANTIYFGDTGRRAGLACFKGGALVEAQLGALINKIRELWVNRDGGHDLFADRRVLDGLYHVKAGLAISVDERQALEQLLKSQEPVISEDDRQVLKQVLKGQVASSKLLLKLILGLIFICVSLIVARRFYIKRKKIIKRLDS